MEVDDSVLEDHVGDFAVGHFRELPLRAHQLLRRQRDRIRTSLLKGKSGISGLTGYPQMYRTGY